MVKVRVGILVRNPRLRNETVVGRLRDLIAKDGGKTGHFTVTERDEISLFGDLYIDETFRASTRKEVWLRDDGVIKAEIDWMPTASEKDR